MAKIIQLRNGGETIVDDDIFEKYGHLYWHKSRSGYVIAGFKKDNLKPFAKLHREIMGNPIDLVIDHIDRNKLNNQRSNLRIATISQNTQNCPFYQAQGVSKYKGVSYEQKKKWFSARCRAAGKDVFLGHFKSEIAAAHAYNKYAKTIGEFMYINPLPIDEVSLDKIMMASVVNIRHAKKKSRFKNIFYRERKGKSAWIICIVKGGKRINKGDFNTENEAANYYSEHYSHIAPLSERRVA